MKEKAAVSVSMVLVIIAILLAFIVMLGASVLGIDPVNLLAAAIVLLGIAIVIPG